MTDETIDDVRVICSPSGNLKVKTRKLPSGYSIQADFRRSTLVVVVGESLEETKADFCKVMLDIGGVFLDAAKGCE